MNLFLFSFSALFNQPSEIYWIAGGLFCMYFFILIIKYSKDDFYQALAIVMLLTAYVVVRPIKSSIGNNTMKIVIVLLFFFGVVAQVGSIHRWILIGQSVVRNETQRFKSSQLHFFFLIKYIFMFIMFLMFLIFYLFFHT